jgi:STE24 endopeptidase
MNFTVIAGILIALAAEVDPELARAAGSGFDPAACILWTVALVASAPAAGLAVAALVRPETLRDASERARALRVVRVGGFVSQAWLLAAFALATYWVRWPLLVEGTLRLHGWVLVGTLARLAPFLAMLLLSWFPAWRVDRSLRPGAWSLREYVEFQTRQNVLLPLAPVLAFVTLDDLLRASPWGRMLEDTGLEALLMIALAAAGFVYSAEALRRIWKTRRLPEGPLRERLEALETRAGIFSRDLLVWDTLGGHLPNACVAGATARRRYVMITDALTEILSPEEIEAVFAHELGHVKGRHVAWYALLTVSLFAGLAAAGSLPAAQAMSARPMGGLLSPAGFLFALVAALYWGLGFAFVSRRMELEADLYAASLCGTAAFVGALERISFYSGRPRDAGSWRHFSAARRTGFLIACEADPSFRERFQRRMKLLRFGLAALAVAAAAAAAMLLL